MLHDPKAYLYNIVKACDAIISYTKGMDNVGYLQDRMIQDAVERNFITIGEALNRIKTEAPEISSQNLGFQENHCFPECRGSCL